MGALHKNIIITSIFFFTICFLQAQRSVKVGIANTENILSSLPQYPETKKNLERYTNQWKEQVDLKTKELEEKKDDFVKNQQSYIIEVLEEKAKEIQRLQQDIQSLQQRANESLQNKQKELLEPLLLKIRDGIKRVAQKNSYTFIFAHNAAANYPFLYADSTDDITQKVIEELVK